MKLGEVHKLEKAVIMILNFDGWNLEWTGNTYKHFDAKGYTSKGFPCVIEMKFRDKYYSEKMLEKYKYDELMKLSDDFIKLYFINDPKGNFMYWLNNLKMPKIQQLYYPDTTMWTRKRVKKDVYLLQENEASIINLNNSFNKF